MENLVIDVKNFPTESGNRCIVTNRLLKRAQSLDISQYECFACAENAFGSFVYIENQVVTKQLSICDVKVYGRKLTESGNFNVL